MLSLAIETLLISLLKITQELTKSFEEMLFVKEMITQSNVYMITHI